MRTIKLPIIWKSKEEQERFIEIQKNYNNLLRFSYNRIKENTHITTKEITVLQKQMNNIFLDSHFKNCAFQEARALFNKNDKIIFGGKKLFFERQNNKITKEDFQIQKLIPLLSIGENLKQYTCNRKFQILSLKEILFKFTKHEHFILTLPKLRKNYQKLLQGLLIEQTNKKQPITYKLDKDFIYISFNEFEIKENLKQIKNRILAIDMNPNYIGYSVIDWTDSDTFNIINKGIFSLKQLNDKDFALKGKGLNSQSKERIYIRNKREYELIKITDLLINIVKQYQCEIFAYEELNIKSNNKKKGKYFNKLCNNIWNKNLLIEQIEKRCIQNKIQIIKVYANYSSFIGNLAYRNTRLPDQILASIEIGRRAFEFNHQYILKDKQIEKNIIFNNSNNTKINIIQSLEELNFKDNWNDFKDLYNKLKTLKMNYRVLLNQVPCSFQTIFSKRSLLTKAKFAKCQFINKPKGLLIS
jgi:hypothetical protein